MKGGRCGARKTLKKQIEFYVRTPKCPSCKHDSLVFDKYRNLYETGSRHANVCRCDGMHFPHRSGSKWCRDFEGEYDEIDMQFGQPGMGSM